MKTGGTRVLLHLRPEKCSSMYWQYIYFKLEENTKQKYETRKPRILVGHLIRWDSKNVEKWAKLAGKWPKCGKILSFSWVKGLLT